MKWWKSRNRYKHRILESLVPIFHEEESPPYFGYVRSEKFDEVIRMSDSYKLCLALFLAREIQREEFEHYDERFAVTDLGRNAFYTKKYLNKIWYRNRNFYIYILSLSISAGALVVSIIALVKVN